MSEGAKMGRPSSYSPEVATKLCERIARSSKSVATICKGKGMPSLRTVFRWLAHPEREDFRQLYARAQELRAEYLAEELLDIADDGRNDWVERETRNGSYVALNEEALQRSRLRIDARKWLMAKFKPKRFGDKLELAGDPNAPLNVSVVRFTEATK